MDASTLATPSWGKPIPGALRRTALLFPVFVALSACGGPTGTQTKFLGDEAIRRVEDCECFKTVDAQTLKPWELAWDDSEKLRTQISRCVCRAEIDVANVANPKRYVVVGTVVK